jgi:hypothetical protein
VVWRALFGVRGRRLYCLSACCQRAAEDRFTADDGSVSEGGCSFRCCTVGEFSHDCDSVSVMTVQEKCDEKGLGAASGHRNVRCRQFGRAPLRLSLRAGFLEKREKGRTPGALQKPVAEQRLRTLDLSPSCSRSLGLPGPLGSEVPILRIKICHKKLHEDYVHHQIPGSELQELPRL